MTFDERIEEIQRVTKLAAEDLKKIYEEQMEALVELDWKVTTIRQELDRREKHA